MFQHIIPNFKKAMKNQDVLETKILTYTNDRVNQYNNKVKEILFGNISEYDKFQFLTCYENLEFNGVNFYNSMDYIVIDDPIKTRIDIPEFTSLPGWKLNLYDPSLKISEEILILSKDITKDYLDSLAQLIESIRFDAIELKKYNSRSSRDKWKLYYKLIGSFTSPFNLYFDNRLIRKKSFDHGFACTIHKSQGKSLNNVFIDMKDVMICRNFDELRQLQYVSVSRARNDVHIYQ